MTATAPGLILFESSRLVTGHETDHVLATVGPQVSNSNLLPSLLGFARSGE